VKKGIILIWCGRVSKDGRDYKSRYNVVIIVTRYKQIL
jgi:hypothetical protein